MKLSIIEPIPRPPARKPHGKQTPYPSTLAGNQEGRARVRLHDSPWIVPISLGWVFAFAGELAPTVTEHAAALLLAMFLIGFGVGWIYRDERDRGERAD